MEKEYRKDRSLLYMSLGLGSIIMVLGYLTLFVDDANGLFSREEKKVAAVGEENDSDILVENSGMNDAEVRASLVKFIESFYTDQQKGYFDPPSYFSPITKTYFNYHNLTYQGLKELHDRRSADQRDYDLRWIVSTLDYERSGQELRATYWTKVNYVQISVNRKISADIKYEMLIDKNGKISSLRELEIKNQVSDQLYEPVDMPYDNEDSDYPGFTSPDEPIIPLPDPTYNQEEVIPAEGALYNLGTVEIAPEFRGGSTALAMFLGARLHYPAIAREKNTQGKVYISFVVEKDGRLTDFKVIKGIGDGCDEEAVRVLRSCPPWKAGMLGGKAVRTSYVLPVTFMLVD